ncbi:hypothetical protein F4781DRAFT_390787 [Annulohypoxylon bovei var. microspora]|nr:hypothetical protein F4781DRAFT_390787 [Annulohypoxylon bovei var. microspora]
MSHCWLTPEANRGYSAPGREKTTTLTDINDVKKLRDAAPDLKESLEIGREGVPDYPNHWPAEEGELAGFKETMLGFHDKCKELHMEVMRAIAVGLDIDETWFDGYTDLGDNTLRLLHYPEVKKDVFTINPGQVRAGAHSDYGSITLLFQDARGGLQVRSPTGVFVDATPIEDTCVVNAGDLLARWSNDNIKSTIHRVVEPPSGDGDAYPARYSIAYVHLAPFDSKDEMSINNCASRYFCNPNFNRYIEAIPGTYAAETERKYEGINSGQYLVQRLTATY